MNRMFDVRHHAARRSRRDTISNCSRSAFGGNGADRRLTAFGLWLAKADLCRSRQLGLLQIAQLGNRVAKSVLIFADGTGQIGGLRPDQRLSNVYKMYRAMRPGPSSPISYHDHKALEAVLGIAQDCC